MIVGGKFIKSELMGKKIRQLKNGGYKIQICLEDRCGNGIMYFIHNSDRCENIAFPFKEFNVNDEVEIEYNQLGTIYRYYNGEVPSL